MCRSHLVKGWVIMIVMLLAVASLAPIAGGAGSDGLVVDVKEMPFNQFVKELVRERGKKNLVMLCDVSSPVTVSALNSMPIEEILQAVCAQEGLDFWQNDSSYFIGKRKAADVPVAVSAPATPAFPTADTPVAEPQKARSYTQLIELTNTDQNDWVWAFGYPGSHAPSKEAKKELQRRVGSRFNPARNFSVTPDTGANYSSPMQDNYYTPGTFTNRNDASNGNQFPTPGTIGGFPGVGGTGGYPTTGGGFPGVGGPTYPTTGGGFPTTGGGTFPQIGGVTPNAQNRNNAAGAGLLSSYLPDGIENITGIEALNTLLVRASNPEAIEQLAGFIKLLDRPTRQVLIEAMFVKMTVADASSLGANLSVMGTAPWSVVTGGSGANPSDPLQVRYVSGNIRFQLSALVSNSRAKVVNAPRIIVQNGDSASIYVTEEIPFVTTVQQEDIYGRVIDIPEIQMQSFEQGMSVDNVIIHPDNSVSVSVTPSLQNPTSALQLPGVGTSSSSTNNSNNNSNNNSSNRNAGSVYGSSSIDIETRLRIKSGETVIMGGFVSNNEQDVVSQTPLLSQIPILGKLFFRNTARTVSNTETLLFVTPTILEEDKTTFEGMSVLPPMF